MSHNRDKSCAVCMALIVLLAKYPFETNKNTCRTSERLLAVAHLHY